MQGLGEEVFVAPRVRALQTSGGTSRTPKLKDYGVFIINHQRAPMSIS